MAIGYHIYTWAKSFILQNLSGQGNFIKLQIFFFSFFLGEVRIPGVKNKIYYEPDSGDDWDDEDPDEDLDL